MFHARAKEITIIKEKCNGCRNCVKLCGSDVIRFDEERETPVIKYPEDCEACMLCEVFCPQNALHVVPAFPIHVPDPFR